MGATTKTFVPRFMESTEPTPGISLCFDDLLMSTRALDLNEIRAPLRFVPVVVLIPKPSPSVQGQSVRAKTPRDRSLSEAEPTKVLRVSPKLSEQGKTPNLEGESLFGRVTVNFAEMSAYCNGEPIVLTALEFKVLQYLARNPRRVISRDELLNEVWGYENYPCTRTVDNHILRLRQKLEQNPSRPIHIRTVHGAGYKFLP